MTATGPDRLYLSPDQQDLLLAALTSNSSSSAMFNTPSLSRGLSIPPQSHDTPDSMGSQYGNGTPPPTALTAGFPDGTPLLGRDLDYPGWDNDVGGDWDYDLSIPPGDVDKSMDSYVGTPVSMSNSIGERDGEKRKGPPEAGDGSPSVDPHDAEPKRRESNDKVAKKPGRKPLTSEPTSKRKAQNRAAQRAFRERKEKHLKDLEEKVADLEKASESANHENGLLRAQVDRLQIEVKEYKRRLHSAGQSASPPFVPPSSSPSSLFPNGSGIGNTGGFQFEFPLFGNSHFLRQNSRDGGPKLASGTFLDRLNAAGSPNSSRPTGPTAGSSGDGDKYYSPTRDLPSSLQNTPRLNGSGRDCDSSPSASSVSQHGPGSSAGTSPEPTGRMREGKITTAANGDKYICKSGPLDGETETTFCEKLGMACGTPKNPIPKASQLDKGNRTNRAGSSTDATSIPDSLAWLMRQNGGTGNFDPVLFNDYRDPVNDIHSSINMSFFDDAFRAPNFGDLGSPLNLAQTPRKSDSFAGVDRQDKDSDEEDGEEEEVVPADDPQQMLSCNKIWDRISTHPRFASGELDMDNLCVELRSKAKCSETGVVVAETDVQEVLTKVGVSHKDVLG